MRYIMMLSGSVLLMQLAGCFAMSQDIDTGSVSPGEGTTEAALCNPVPDCSVVVYSPCLGPCPPHGLEVTIPDDDPTGVDVTIVVPPKPGDPPVLLGVAVDVDITHTFRGDLLVQLISPSGQVATLSNRQGGSADDFVVTGLDVSSSFSASPVAGSWRLFVRDLAAHDVGTINSFLLRIAATSGPRPHPWIVDSSDVPKAIPDNNATGTSATLTVTPPGLDIQRVTVGVDITHPYRGDLVVQVTSPAGQLATLSNREGGSADDFLVTDLDITSSFLGASASGQWRLVVRDLAAFDVGTINAFRLAITPSH